MQRILSFIASCFLLSLLSSGATPTIPDTPAGRVFGNWLEAFNSGDSSLLKAHYQKHRAGKSADRDIQFRTMTGGFDLLSIDENQPQRLVFRVKERLRNVTAIGNLIVDDREPPQVSRFSLLAIPPGSGDPDFTIDAGLRERVIDKAIKKLDQYYVFPDLAKEMAEAVRARQRRGEYASVTDGDEFAKLLTDHFREVNNDKHLRVMFSPVPRSERPANQVPRTARDEQRRKRLEQSNCGFEKAERLAGNIGYVKFNMFADPTFCRPTAIAAMNFLANVNAVIFDLRENRGGHPAMVALLSSYLFSEPTHLNNLWERKSGETKQYWTLSDIPGKRLTEQSAYVLTSRRTFSAAEEFSYNLQQLDRARIVGETTGGGAHPVSGHRIEGRFHVMVPYARAINPISKTNWEGVGVKPDVEVPAVEALDKAIQLARETQKSR
ncbi:MAG: S41 family peptidase [Bryobacterales bacterium]|nr:S41 family peptidase [Bryobacterales bacterium]